MDDGPTFPLDAVIVLAVFMGQRVRGLGLRQQILRRARDPVLTGILGAHATGSRETLDVTAERTLAGADPLAYSTARDHRVLLGALENRKEPFHGIHLHAFLSAKVSKPFHS